MLQVQHLCTFVYHPQTDSLVERFNQMLKRRLCQVINAEGSNWDLLLPYQATLLFVNLLDVAKEAWEEEPSLCCPVIKFIWKMQWQIG